MSPSRVATVAVALAGCFLHSAAAAAPKDAKDSPLTAFLKAPFSRVDTLAELPTQVRQSLDAALHNEAIADAGADWEPTDVRDGSRPALRLLFAGHADALWFVFLEEGGVFVGRHLWTFRRGPTGQVSLEGTWRVEAEPRVIADSKAAVAAESAHSETRDIGTR
jgi:hypothetical protein